MREKVKNKSIIFDADTSAIDNTVAAVPGAADATEAVENSFLAESTKAKSEEEVMYFLIGAIVASVVLVRSSSQLFTKMMSDF